jgi:hypothetical protein
VLAEYLYAYFNSYLLTGLHVMDKFW